MNSVRDAAKEFVSICTLSLDLTASERASIFCFLVSHGRGSQRTFEIVCEIYHLVATGEWNPSLADLCTLVYGPLDNPALIPHVEGDMERILDSHSNRAQLRVGWRYVQMFSPSATREF